jgi:ferredoxin
MAFRRQLTAYGHPVSVVPEDELGRLDLASALGDLPEGSAVYACGPAGLLDAIESFSDDWPAGTLHMERFKSKDISNLASTPVEIYCQRSDVTVAVPAENSLLDELERAGINVPSACRDGVCGSCEVPVLEGIPEHRDSMWNSAEDSPRNSLMVCVSRAKSERLVLDI